MTYQLELELLESMIIEEDYQDMKDDHRLNYCMDTIMNINEDSNLYDDSVDDSILFPQPIKNFT